MTWKHKPKVNSLFPKGLLVSALSQYRKQNNPHGKALTRYQPESHLPVLVGMPHASERFQAKPGAVGETNPPGARGTEETVRLGLHSK